MTIPGLRAIPGIRAAATYQRAWLSRDLVAGLVLASLLVPQGMAYAELAGLPAITGLYTSILCLVAYAALGPSRVLVLGPDSALGSMIAATVLPLTAAGGDPGKAVVYASVLALMVGAVMVVGARAGLGFVADLLSKPTQIGYMNGLALTILISQLPKLFGFSTDASGMIAEGQAFAHGVASGQAVPQAVALGTGSLVLMVVLGRWLPRVPGVLAAVIVAMGFTAAFNLGAAGVKLVGVLPSGLPPFSLPIPGIGDLVPLAAGAIGIAVVSLADTISTSSAFAARHKQEVHPNQEMVGIGAANLAAGLFGGFPVSTSGSRTAVAERAGAKTQLTGLVGAASIAVMLVLLPGLLQWLPQPTLGAVVIVASLSLADIRGTQRLYRQRRSQFAVSMAAFLGVALLGVLPGIAVAVALSILAVFRQAWDPYRTELEDVPGVPGWHDVRMYPESVEVPGLVIYRFGGPLIFANAGTFRDDIRAIARREPAPRWILIAAEAIVDIDVTAADMLEEIHGELAASGIDLAFAELKDAVRSEINAYGFDWLAERDTFYPTITAAVRAYRTAFGVAKPTQHIADGAAKTTTTELSESAPPSRQAGSPDA